MGAGSSFTQVLLQCLLENLATFYQEADVPECGEKENGESLHARKVPVVLILVIPIPEQLHLVELHKSSVYRKGQELSSGKNEAITQIQKIVKETLAKSSRQRPLHYSSFLLSACSHQENSNENKKEV